MVIWKQTRGRAALLLSAVSCVGCNNVLGLEPGSTLCDATWAHWDPRAERNYETTEESALDLVTGLRWSRTPTPAQGFPMATSSCEQAEIEGESGWRLPTRIELLSLLDLTHSPPLDGEVFSLPAEIRAFWTTSAPANKPVLLSDGETLASYILSVDLTSGHVLMADPADPAKQLLGLCVRAEEVELPGIAAASCTQRYTEEPDDAVIHDRETGLAWQKGSSEASIASLDEARALCEGLTLAGGGFRLPKVGELETLIDEANPGGVAIDAHFDATSDYYWSSSENAERPGEAWVVSFYNGEAFSFPGSGPLPDGSDPVKRVRCVR